MDEARKAIAEGTELCRRWDREALGWSNTFSVSMAAWGGEPPGPDTLVHGRRAVEIAEEIGDAFSRIIAYSWLALAHSLVGDHEEAMRVADHCLGMIAERGAGLEFEPTVRGVRAEAYRAQGELDQAVEEGELARQLAEERGAVSIGPRTRLVLAEILLARRAAGDIKRAGDLLGEAERLARDLSARPDVAQALRGRAHICAVQEDHEGRDSLLAEALEMAREMDARGLIEQIDADLGEPAASR